MADTQKQIVTVGVTGASGALLAQKILVLLEEDARVERVHLVVTEAGQRLFAEELGITSGEFAAGAGGGSGDYAGGAGVLSPSENDRRPCYAIRVPRARANRAFAGPDVSLGGYASREKSGGVRQLAIQKWLTVSKPCSK